MATSNRADATPPEAVDLTPASLATGPAHSSMHPTTHHDAGGLERLVMDINSICRHTTLQFALAVGQMVVQGIYAGNTELLRSRTRKHHTALRTLANHPALSMSAGMLYHCVGVYEICERLQMRLWRHVSTSHIRLVLPLVPDLQERLLRQAETQRWPVSRLEQEVVALGPPDRSRGGRPRQSRVRRRVLSLLTELRQLLDLLETGNALEKLSPDSSREALDGIRQATAACAAIEQRLTKMP
jgi:hypothetical protein